MGGLGRQLIYRVYVKSCIRNLVINEFKKKKDEALLDANRPRSSDAPKPPILVPAEDKHPTPTRPQADT